MNRTEHLNAIVAKCRALLALDKKRTDGEWSVLRDAPDGQGQLLIVSNHDTNEGEDAWRVAAITNHCGEPIATEHNAAFIAACAGSAEAGWQSTIAAIEGLRGINAYYPHLADGTLDAIIAAWPVELLGETA